MKLRIVTVLAAAIVAVSVSAAAYLRLASGSNMTRAAQAYLATLSEEQRTEGLLPYQTPARVGWHFIPMDDRKGVQIKEMSAEQRKAAFALLQSALSEVGYGKARTIMALEGVLHELAKTRGGGPIRDPERYYYTLFGEPGEAERWGLSIEGHHLSLNFAVENGRVIASTPTFFAANPSVVQHEFEGCPEKGTRVLAREETLAFELLASLDKSQREQAVVAKTAPREIRAAGEAQPPAYEKRGVGFGDLKPPQQRMLRELVNVYAGNLPEDVSAERMTAIENAGWDQVFFAWAGADRPGIGHYYLVQGPTFLIEFVNVQPDGAGNPASHIHSVWRDPKGDFALPIAARK